jgi:hypothetical protein
LKRRALRSSRVRRSAVCLLLATFGPSILGHVFADEAPTSTEPPPLVITILLDNDARQTHYDNPTGSSNAASQGVVKGGLLGDLPLLRPGEALETIPGVVVTQHSGDGKANQYFLRGYNLDHGTDFATSVDGVPINMPTNAHGQGYSDLNFLIPELVSTMDYRKGPYYASDGDFSSAGSADIHYRDAFPHNIAGLTSGAFGYRRALFAGSTSVESIRPIGADSGTNLLWAIEAMRNDGPWATPQGLHKLNGLLHLGNGTASSGWSLDALHYDAQWTSTDQVPISLIASGQLGRYSALDPTDGGNTGREILSGEWHAQDSNGYARVSAYVEHYRLQLWSDFTFYELRSALAPNPTLPSDQFEQAESRNMLGTALLKGWSHRLLGHESTTEAGLQLRRDNIDVGLLDTQSRQPFATVTSDAVGETETGVYLENTTRWTRQLRTTVGLREQHVDMHMESHVMPQNSGVATASKLLPKFSAALGPWNKTEFFANAGKGFHSNDARGVIDKIDPTTGLAASPVPALVGSFGKEVGLRTGLIPRLQSSLALWGLNSDSELVYNADSDIGSTSPNGASQRHGVEWDNHLVVNRWMLLDGNLAWVHARYASANAQPGDQIPNAVGKVALFAATVNGYDGWSGGIETRYIGPYPLSQDGSLVAPSAVITNLRAQRVLTQSASLTMDVLNLFSRDYYDIAYAQDYQVSATSPVVPDGITVHPGEPRQLRVSLSVRY